VIEIAVIECAPGHPQHQVVLNVNGVIFWLQTPSPDKASAHAVADQVKSNISTQVARLKKDEGGNG